MTKVRYLNQDPNISTGKGAEREARDDQNRGRRAAAPWQIPWKGWKDILIRTYEQVNKDRVLAVVAGGGFFWFLGVFPAVTGNPAALPLFFAPPPPKNYFSNIVRLFSGGGFFFFQDQA